MEDRAIVGRFLSPHTSSMVEELVIQASTKCTDSSESRVNWTEKDGFSMLTPQFWMKNDR